MKHNTLGGPCSYYNS